jgi:ABC-2 type transport system ATP-binding protein
MRSIVGVQRIHSGEVTVFGSQAGSAQLRSRVGYLTQAPSLYSDLTVRENVRYFASILSANHSEVNRVMDVVKIAEHADSVVDRLSGGERARASLAVALLNEPLLLVLDEPTVGLDPVLRQDLWNFFRDLAAAGVTLLISSHVMDEASRCDRLVLMREGLVIANATLPELLKTTGTIDIESAYLQLVNTQGGDQP